MRVLVVTSEWPTPERPTAVPFVVRQVEQLRTAGVEVEVFSFRGAKKLRNYVRARRRLTRVLQGGRFDLIHCQWGQSTLLAMGRRIPFVVTFRGSDLEGIVGKRGRYTFKGWVLRQVSRTGARAAKGVMVVSDRLGKRLPASVDYRVLPSSIDLNLFRPIPRSAARERLGLPATARLVLFAARPGNPVKRFHVAKTAVDLVAKDLPDAQLVVAQDVPYEEMPYYMGACDALIVTSAHEGSPNVVKEALACDLPVVSVDVGNVRERLSGVEGCHLVSSGRLEDLARVLCRVLEAPYRVNGRGSVESLEDAFVTRQVVDVYREAIGGAPRTPVNAGASREA